MSPRVWAWIADSVVSLVLGFVIGYAVYHPRPAAPVKEAPEFRQADGSLGLKVQPATAAEASKIIPHLPMVPAGATLVRAEEAVLQPHPTASNSTEGAKVEAGAPAVPLSGPIRVDLALVKLADGSERVLVSSPDATVTGGIDIPTVQPTRGERGWAVGGFYNPSSRAWGPIAMKDLGPFRVFAEGRIERLQVAGTQFSNNSVDLGIVVHF